MNISQASQVETSAKSTTVWWAQQLGASANSRRAKSGDKPPT